MLSTFSILPSPKVCLRCPVSVKQLIQIREGIRNRSGGERLVVYEHDPKLECVQPYNALLSYHQLVENCDLTVCLDNEALYVYQLPRPSQRVTNGSVSQDLTSPRKR